MTEGWGSRLAERVVDDLERLSEPGLTAAKARLLHGLRVSVASVGLPAAVMAAATFDGERGPCLTFGRSEGLAAQDAALVNGVIAHSSLQEDCGPGGLREGSHPGTYIIPAALAATQQAGGSGLDLLRALVAGYEVVSRIGEAAPQAIVGRRFRPVGVMGPFGAAAAAAVAGGADATALAGALAIAANMSSGSTQGVFDGSMEPYFHAGIAARNGLLAARLGTAGVETSAHFLEGDFGFFETYGGTAGDVEALLAEHDQLGIERVGSKQFAACLQNQETMALVGRNVEVGLDPDEVRSVVVRRPALGTHGLNSPGVSREPPYSNMLHAQMSARFTTAVMLTGGAGDDPDYFQRSFDDPDLTALTERIELVPTESAELIEVEVETASGSRTTWVSDGSTSSMFPGHDVLRERFVAGLDRAGPGRGAHLAAVVDQLESAADLVELVTGLRDASLATPG